MSEVATVVGNDMTAASRTKTDLYIPPPEVKFRILGYSSNCVIVSRTHLEPQVDQITVTANVYSDQWFKLIYGTGENTGLYAIKSCETHKVLYSHAGASPRVGHIDGDGKRKDNWFKIEPGTGTYTNYFRLITPSENMALISRTHMEPHLDSFRAHEVYPDHYFTFIYEKMQVDRIEYHFDDAKILTSTPIVLAIQALTNDSETEQEMGFSFKKSIVNSSSFEYSTGFTVEVGTEFKAGVPLVADGKFSISAASTNTWTWGSTTEYSVEYTASFPVKAGPKKTVQGKSVINKGTLDVPFTMFLSSKSSGGKVETKGTWRGVSSWDLRHTVTRL